MGREPHWNHNTHYHRLALSRLSPGDTVLDVGCGEGLLTRRAIAAGAAAATGIDAEPDQVRLAHDRAAGDPRLSYLAGDVMTTALAGHDLVTCIATLHHLDLEPGLTRLRDLTAPGGTLVVVGLARPSTPIDWLLSAAAVPVARWAGRLRGEWDHCAPTTDPTTTYRDVRSTARRVLPGVRWRRHVYWRYSLTWRAPS
jgi:2-polyprenyl-3-methyl-5-hydroxy-6-metoxy-1,4-benzoquinol methylase